MKSGITNHLLSYSNLFLYIACLTSTLLYTSTLLCLNFNELVSAQLHCSILFACTLLKIKSMPQGLTKLDLPPFDSFTIPFLTQVD